MMQNDRYAELLKTQKPRISLSFALDSSGITTLVKAEATLEETIKVPIVKSKLNSTNNANNTNANETAAEGNESESASTTNEANAAADAAGGASGASAATAAGDDEVEYTSKKKVHSVSLKIVRSGNVGSIENLSLADKSASKATLARLSRADDLKREIAAAKNTLESYIYATRTEINEENLESISTAEQREAVVNALAAAEEWLYEQSADDSAKIFKDKLAELKKLADPIFFRFSEIAGNNQS